MAKLVSYEKTRIDSRLVRALSERDPMPDILDRLGEAFAEFMEPDEAGTPLVSRQDLSSALEAAGLAGELALQLGPRMDPDDTGFVGFSEFVSICTEALSGSEHDKKHSSRRVFRMLREDAGSGRITLTSLRDATTKLHFDSSDADLKAMLQVAGAADDTAGVTADQFAQLWKRLNDMLGPEVGAEVLDLPRSKT